jgi:hypothetical protein
MAAGRLTGPALPPTLPVNYPAARPLPETNRWSGVMTVQAMDSPLRPDRRRLPFREVVPVPIGAGLDRGVGRALPRRCGPLGPLSRGHHGDRPAWFPGKGHTTRRVYLSAYARATPADYRLRTQSRDVGHGQASALFLSAASG